MNSTHQLERLALDAHHQNMPWATFWAEHGDRVRAIEPFNRQRFQRLVNRLLHLLVTGDTSGEHPAGDVMPPWERDDAIGPHDTITSAKLLWEPGRGGCNPYGVRHERPFGQASAIGRRFSL